MNEIFARHFFLDPRIVDGAILQRISRHLVLGGWGIYEQLQLDSQRILVIGAGGLGCSLCLQLSASVFKNAGITVLDHDRIEHSNLHRQIAFGEADIGMNKADRLVQVCMGRNSDCNIVAISDSFNTRNCISLFDANDVVFDCTDNVPTRILISDTWIRTGRVKTVISASCVGWSGQLAVLGPGSSCCLRCVYGEETDSSAACDRQGQCALQGVMGPVVGLMANYQFLGYMHTIKRHSTNAVSVKLFDFSDDTTIRKMDLAPNCAICTGKRELDPFASGSEPEHAACTGPECTTEEFLALLESEEGCRIIDVREASHFKYSHFAGSLNLPASTFLHAGPQTSPLPLTQFGEDTKPVVVVCRRGIDSLKSTCKLLSIRPIMNVVSLRGGLTGLGVDIV